MNRWRSRAADIFCSIVLVFDMGCAGSIVKIVRLTAPASSVGGILVRTTHEEPTKRLIGAVRLLGTCARGINTVMRDGWSRLVSRTSPATPTIIRGGSAYSAPRPTPS